MHKKLKLQSDSNALTLDGWIKMATYRVSNWGQYPYGVVNSELVVKCQLTAVMRHAL